MNILALPNLFKELNRKLESSDGSAILVVDIEDQTGNNGGYIVRLVLQSAEDGSRLLVRSVYAYGKFDHEEAVKRADTFTKRLRERYSNLVVTCTI